MTTTIRLSGFAAASQEKRLLRRARNPTTVVHRWRNNARRLLTSSPSTGERNEVRVSTLISPHSGSECPAFVSAQYGFDGVLLRDGQDTSRMEKKHDKRAHSAIAHSCDASVALSGKFPSRAAISWACLQQMKRRNSRKTEAHGPARSGAT